MVLSFILSLTPVIWIIVALSLLKMRAHLACLSGLAIAALLAFAWRQMDIACLATAGLEGILNALWPICLLIIAALFTFNLVIYSGAMDKIKLMLCSVSADKRILALMIAWGFGAFMEGMAGFGTPVAIPGALLVGLGVQPIPAIVACLVSNASHTPFGSAGIPLTALSSVSGIDQLALSSNIATIEALIAIISPFFVVTIVGGGPKALKGVVPATFVASLGFAVPWFATAQLIGPELPDIIGSICSMAFLLLYVRAFKPKPDPAYAMSGESTLEGRREESIGFAEGAKAWSPFIFILLFLFITSTLCPPVHDALAKLSSTVTVYCGSNPGTLTFNWVATPGVMIFLAAIIGGIIQGAHPRGFLIVLVSTLKSYWRTVVTICSVLAMAKIMGYSGMTRSIAEALILIAGPFFPLVAPLIGMLGGFVTGSGTSSNILFGQLQTQTAAGLGLNEPWITASNSVGAGIGKMLCPQSIAIGMSATNQEKIESRLMRATAGYFLLFCVLAACICMIGTLL